MKDGTDKAVIEENYYVFYFNKYFSFKALEYKND